MRRLRLVDEEQGAMLVREHAVRRPVLGDDSLDGPPVSSHRESLGNLDAAGICLEPVDSLYFDAMSTCFQGTGLGAVFMREKPQPLRSPTSAALSRTCS